MESKVINKDIAVGVAGARIEEDEEEEEDVPLPGFRFHPTDEELVSFYLTRKVENKSFTIDLIKQIDIYKYDPWDLPKASNIGDKEWYFFCKRGRKYRNSLRPNRVTGSGFWKATGIDKPIYSSTAGGDGRDCIGLKKSLVYYRGSSGKGTKTDWMMHEFRLPGEHDKPTNRTDHVKPVTQDAAEVWTLSRIFKRNVKYRKCIPDLLAKPPVDSNFKRPCSSSSNFGYSTEDREKYVSFNPTAPAINMLRTSSTDINNHEMKPDFSSSNAAAAGQVTNINSFEAPSYYTNMIPADFFVKNNADYWDELSSVVDPRSANTDFPI